MEYLLNTVVTYRVHTVEEAEAMHERFKNDGRFEETLYKDKVRFKLFVNEVVFCTAVRV